MRYQVLACHETINNGDWNMIWETNDEAEAIRWANAWSEIWDEVVVEDDEMDMEEPDHVIYRT